LEKFTWAMNTKTSWNF